VAADGTVVQHFDSGVAPDSPQFIDALEMLLE
jgi:hypothetical protein